LFILVSFFKTFLIYSSTNYCIAFGVIAMSNESCEEAIHFFKQQPELPRHRYAPPRNDKLKILLFILPAIR